jgi:oligopeptidase A
LFIIADISFSGAWMNSLYGRAINPQLLPAKRLPVAYLICNQQAPVANQPSLMSIDEISTLFRKRSSTSTSLLILLSHFIVLLHFNHYFLDEFGHGLQHMLTSVHDGNVSGIQGIEWDAVELPSQFMVYSLLPINHPINTLSTPSSLSITTLSISFFLIYRK